VKRARARAVPREAVARLFLARQHLDRPLARPFSPAAVLSFVSDAGGLQLDSINAVARAHYLTVWSRFGAYDPAALDRLSYARRDLFEYWAHAACLVPAADLPAWARAMADYRRRHTGWSSWLKAHPRVLRRVEDAVRRRGPLGAGDLEERDGRAAGWWDWGPARHALHYLWMSGRLAVTERRHFHKRYDLAARVLPEAEPVARAEFPRWHLRKTLRALGAAAEADLPRYLTFPRLDAADRRRALSRMLREGEAVELSVEGLPGRWYALAGDLPALESPPPSRGTALLSPFDSLMWHRGRARALFGFDYKIEVYTPESKRAFGYYTMPILHDGKLIGRVDPRTRRAEGRLEARAIRFEAPAGDDAFLGVAKALKSLAAFVGASEVTAPPGPVADALR
jgi:uncharacterized protein YcaQ